jgi:transposase
MRTEVPPTTQPATVAQPATILVSLELSQKNWVITVQPPDVGKMSSHTVEACDCAKLFAVLDTHRAKTAARTGGEVSVVTIQEAGLDGFWLHRRLEANGIESHVVDAASIAAPRRKRRAKTDSIDGETLVRTLAAWCRRRRSTKRTAAACRASASGC